MEWLSLLVQVPLVGAFILYSLEMVKRANESQKLYMDALDRRDVEYDKRNGALINAINAMSTSIISEVRESAKCQNEHDEFVRENIARRSTTPPQQQQQNRNR
jgi:hypothetical protein